MAHPVGPIMSVLPQFLLASTSDGVIAEFQAAASNDNTPDFDAGKNSGRRDSDQPPKEGP
jgi:hypothetical protein